MKEIKVSCPEDVYLALLGNKLDLEKFREIQIERALEFKKEHGIQYFAETSAKSGENVEKLFIDAAKFMYIKYKDQLHKLIDDEASSQSSRSNSMDLNQKKGIGLG